MIGDGRRYCADSQKPLQTKWPALYNLNRCKASSNQWLSSLELRRRIKDLRGKAETQLKMLGHVD